MRRQSTDRLTETMRVGISCFVLLLSSAIGQRWLNAYWRLLGLFKHLVTLAVWLCVQLELLKPTAANDDFFRTEWDSVISLWLEWLLYMIVGLRCIWTGLCHGRHSWVFVPPQLWYTDLSLEFLGGVWATGVHLLSWTEKLGLRESW